MHRDRGQHLHRRRRHHDHHVVAGVLGLRSGGLGGAGCAGFGQHRDMPGAGGGKDREQVGNGAGGRRGESPFAAAQLRHAGSAGQNEHGMVGAVPVMVHRPIRDLVGEAHDGDAMWPSSPRSGVDRGADVGAVHVHIPQRGDPIAGSAGGRTVPVGAGTDHRHAVAQGGEFSAQPAHFGVTGPVQQVHHFVLVSGGATLRMDNLPCARANVGARGGASTGTLGYHRQQCLQQQGQPATARVHHSSGGQRGELARGVGQRAGCGSGGGRRHLAEVVGGHHRSGLRGRVQHGQHRTGHRVGHRRLGQLVGPAQTRSQPGTVPGRGLRLSAGTEKGFRQATQYLRKDHSGVTPGPHQCAAGQHRHRAARRDIPIVTVSLQHRIQPGPHGGQQIRTGVLVGHREHVERVNLVTMRRQRVTAGDGPAPDRRPV